MNCLDCLDCLNTSTTTKPAVAVCTECGAAICRDHLVIQPRRLIRYGAMGREEPVDPPARTARCTTCAAAVTARGQLPARPLALPSLQQPLMSLG